MPQIKQNTGFLDFVHNFYKGLRTHEVTLAYEGEMTHELMKVFTGIAMGKMNGEADPGKTQRRVYHVMIECLQNISKHAFRTDLESHADMNHGILIISKNDSTYLVSTGNLVELEKIESIKTLLEKINSMEKPELDTLYKHQLKVGKLSSRGGAGLGFIDIKRKTGNRLEYHFLPYSNTHSFFLFTSHIERNYQE